MVDVLVSKDDCQSVFIFWQIVQNLISCVSLPSIPQVFAGEHVLRAIGKSDIKIIRKLKKPENVTKEVI